MDIPAGLLDKIGVVGLCVFFVLAMFRGWIIPGPWVKSRLDEKDATILRLREEGDHKNQQIDDLLEAGRTTQQVLTAIEGLAERVKDTS